MSQSFTHHWDEIEYFELALPHAEKVEKVAGVKAGCNGCHAPLAFLAGDIPPKPPAEGTRANEGVSCDLCHAITGHDGEVPFNFNFTVDPAAGTQGTRAGVESPGHEIVVNPVSRHGRVLRHLPQREGPVGAVGQGHPPRVEGEPAGGRPASSARTATCRRRPATRRPRPAASITPMSASTSSTARTTPASSWAPSRCGSTHPNSRPNRVRRSSSPPRWSTPRPGT